MSNDQEYECGCCGRLCDHIAGCEGDVEYCLACWYKLDSGSGGPWPDEPRILRKLVTPHK